jgi:predicted acyl esterase
MTEGDVRGGVIWRFRKARSPLLLEARYPGFRPCTRTFPRGAVVKRGARALTSDITMQQDVAIPLRDGKTIYVDILRPTGPGPFPAILSWGPYGKQGGSIILDDIPGRAGIPQSCLSGLEMFEGPDPAYWCPHGYAIVNVDARGAYSSEGDIHFWGRQDAEDGYDAIEWVGAQPWCNSRVGMSGNSWLAIAQWFIASQQPPHLAAIAPWEGWTDLYRTDVVRGGIPDSGFNEHMIKLFSGNNRVEDVPEMVRNNPLMNSYWEDKIPSLAAIRVPAYVVGSWTNLIHGIGTLAGFRGIASEQKWLRVHRKHEWTDYYENADDLRKFFDYHLKGDQNDWLQTPRVRLSILDPGRRDEINRPEMEFPLARTRYRSLHLDAATRTLSTRAPTAVASTSYDSTATDDHLDFTYRFERDTELTGYFALHLWVSADVADDLDIYVELRRLSRTGRRAVARNIIPPNPIVAWWLERRYRQGRAQFGMMFFSGAKGMHRVSHRATDPARSTVAEPYHTHRELQKIKSGEIVPVDIQIWPLGMKWRVGEQLQLLIAGRKLSTVEFPGVSPADSINRGRHTIYTGGAYDSNLVIPWIPPGHDVTDSGPL